MADGSAAVAANLDDAATSQPLTERPIREEDGLHGSTTAPGGAHEAPSPTAFGLDSTGWVSVAALIVVLIFLWKKVPATVARMLDGRIAAIRDQLDEASRLRAEAEALRAEYEAKARSAHADAEAMRAHAHQESMEIVAKAKADAEALMDRRARMAEDKIAAAERTAIAEVRARAADAAAKAAGLLIAERHDAAADRAMTDRAISGIGRLN
jgi:F-type H+-transporting ATPase subunit b